MKTHQWVRNTVEDREECTQCGLSEYTVTGDECLGGLSKILDVACPNCLSPAGEPCTQPTDTGRKPVTWWHYSREALAIQPQPTGLGIASARLGRKFLS